MKNMFLSFLLFLAAGPALMGQNSTKPTHLEFALMPQIGVLSNGTIGGKNKPGFGYQIEAGLFREINQKINVETAVQFQKVSLKQRSNNLQWPSDVVNGMWVPGLSYEQYETDYLALGLSVGFNLKLIDNKNTLSLHWSGIVRRVIDFDNNLVINESGHFSQFNNDELDNSENKFQFLLGLGFKYTIAFHQKKKLSIGPLFEYSLRDLLRTSKANLLWEYEGGHPLFLGVRIGYKLKSD